MEQTRWMLQTKKDDFNGIADKFGISPVTARVIRNRNVVGEDAVRRYLYGGLDDLYSPHLMKGMDEAVTLLADKIDRGMRIRIVGDYDIDGVCSTYLLYQALQRLSAHVDYEIPDRVRDGYGINEMIIREAYEDGVDTIVTCDNGIAAVDQIEVAKELGMTVIVTDHHDIRSTEDGQVLPPADVVVNPKQESCGYPYKEICGGMVAFKLVQALYEAYGLPDEAWKELIEFAAIATVGDVMKLQDENRIIVKDGLRRMAFTKCMGLRKLMEKNNLDPSGISAYQIGFVIGPCLNAGGRLQTAKLALRLLLSTDETESDRLALELKELNDTRKEMTQKSTAAATELVEQYYMDDTVLVVYLPECHESLAGIIAGRLRERYQKPSFVLTDAEGSVKGSGRSIEAYHMFEALVEVKDLLLKFGGHPMAAGLSLSPLHVDEFRRKLNCNASLTEEDFVEKIWIDVPMPIEYITEHLVKELELLEPFGQGNEKPQFAQKQLGIRSLRILGKNRNAVKMSLVSPQGTAMDSMLFTDGDTFVEKLGSCKNMDVIYFPSINEYNGSRSLQLVIRNYKL